MASAVVSWEICTVSSKEGVRIGSGHYHIVQNSSGKKGARGTQARHGCVCSGQVGLLLGQVSDANSWGFVLFFETRSL